MLISIYSCHIYFIIKFYFILFKLIKYMLMWRNLNIHKATIFRRDLTSLKASSNVNCLSFMIKAMTMAADLLIPDTQCTKTLIVLCVHS